MNSEMKKNFIWKIPEAMKLIVFSLFSLVVLARVSNFDQKQYIIFEILPFLFFLNCSDSIFEVFVEIENLIRNICCHLQESAYSIIIVWKNIKFLGRFFETCIFTKTVLYNR